MRRVCLTIGVSRAQGLAAVTAAEEIGQWAERSGFARPADIRVLTDRGPPVTSAGIRPILDRYDAVHDVESAFMIPGATPAQSRCMFPGALVEGLWGHERAIAGYPDDRVLVAPLNAMLRERGCAGAGDALGTRAMSDPIAPALPGFDAAAFVAATLAEDLGEAGDITSAAVIPADARFVGVMDTRDAVTVAGLPLAEAFFRALDPAVAIERLVEDGSRVPAGTELLRIAGNARALLTAERSALNTVQHLTGIATMTRTYVDRILGTGATLLDTRKTVPGLRVPEKYATRMGGAQNHRMGLWDAAMIKDNHVAVAGSVGEAVRRARDAGIARIIVEVDRVDQIEPALAAGATHLLLDNMAPPVLRGAVTLVGGRVPTEASGGVTLETIRAIAETGVTYVSVGRLTQSAPAADIGLDFAHA